MTTTFANSTREQATQTQRVLLLATASTYRLQAFLDAAAPLGIEAIVALDEPAQLARPHRHYLGLDFTETAQTVAALVALAESQPFSAAIAVDDSGPLLAAQVSAALGLAHNSLHAAEAARNKYLMRTLLAQADVASPAFRRCSTSDDLDALAADTRYPCVVKPLQLNGSRGVIRANNPGEFIAAARRLQRLLATLNPQAASHQFLVEDFIPGVEVALEGLLDRGTLHALALFDKPDPLDGPFFEETIYVTPSRLPADTQAAINACAAAAAAALGLRTGPIHAELRINADGPWIVELAGRSIGGQCSKTLRFGTDAALETLILQQACGMDVETLQRDGRAGGVMMIPIPGPGVLRGVRGEEAARAVAGVEEVEITAKTHYPLVPLPEGDSYLGFIFARGDNPAAVEAALREAHAQLAFDLLPDIPLLH